MGGRDRSMIHELIGGGDLPEVEASVVARDVPVLNAKAQTGAKAAKGRRSLLGGAFHPLRGLHAPYGRPVQRLNE
jgi:hypothetical protein